MREHNGRAMRIGVMGGTFDPIHYGHLFAAEEARLVMDLDRVLFIPAGTPPHKSGAEVTPARRRYDMTLRPSPTIRILKFPIWRFCVPAAATPQIPYESYVSSTLGLIFS